MSNQLHEAKLLRNKLKNVELEAKKSLQKYLDKIYEMEQVI